MPKMTISITEEIKKELEQYGNALNASEVCQNALARELEILATLINGKDNMTLVERLRTEIETTREAAEADGRKLGIQWAQDHGTLKKLEMMSEYVETIDAGRQVDTKLANQVWEYLAEPSIADKFREDYEYPDSFWGEFEEGFIRGATQAFDMAMDEV